jgi:lipopolysaccharide transport system ATP-binding protein
MRPAVEFDGVWKRFRLGERHNSLRDLLPALTRRAFARPTVASENEFWAVRDVSFTVAPGEALGIIGANGAGKSTTLKLLNRVLKPTKGSCRVRGRMGALIEVAAGFHPDLTGRENVYLQGAIMGMKRSEIAAQFDAIVAFAEVERFIDTPVKRYSSGMNARLGFSIAAHLQPQVLIVDEVLAVGDVAFQQRCFERMEGFLRNGVAIVLVSHNLTAISQLCTRALLLQAGQVAASGSAVDVISAYCQKENVASSLSNECVDLTVGTPDRPAEGTWSVPPGTRIRLRTQITVHRPIRSAVIGIVVRDMARSLYVYGATSDVVGVPPFIGKPGGSVAHDFEFDANLARGVYAIEVNVLDIDRQEHIASLNPAAQFTVVEQVTYSGIANLFLRGRRDDSWDSTAPRQGPAAESVTGVPL